jgi:hypothetical protein
MYGWLITHDLIDTDAAGVVGPRGISDKDRLYLDSGRGHRFRMYDDDGKLYYAGLFVGDPASEEGFGPLDDFGEPNAGAVRIDYYDHATRRWETL